MPNHSTSGGHIKDIPLPHKRYFDDSRRRREVRVDILMFSGIGVHYYVYISEEDNHIWDISKDGGWRIAWDDEKGKGKNIRNKFNTPEQAEEFIREILRKQFPSKTHKYRIDDDCMHMSQKWFYKDGD